MEKKYIEVNEGELIRWRGLWSVDKESYALGDVVAHAKTGYGTCTYKASVGHVPSAATEPEDGASWETVWEEFLMGGQNGTGEGTGDVIAAGKAGGQTIIGGTGAGESLDLEGTAHATKGNVRVLSTNGTLCRLQIKNTHNDASSQASFALEAGGKEFIFYVSQGAGDSFHVHSTTLGGDVFSVDNFGILRVTGEKTDHEIAMDHCQAAYASAGTWTISESSNALIVTRTMAQADHYRTHGPIPFPIRTTTSKGAKLKSVSVAYTVGGTIDTTNDIFSVNIIKQTLPTDGSGASASVIAGDDEADLDTDHNTNAKRLAAGSHTLVVTIPVGEQAYAADGEAYYVRIRVKDNSTANLTFVLNGIVAKYAAAEY